MHSFQRSRYSHAIKIIKKNFYYQSIPFIFAIDSDSEWNFVQKKNTTEKQQNYNSQQKKEKRGKIVCAKNEQNEVNKKITAHFEYENNNQIGNVNERH